MQVPTKALNRTGVCVACGEMIRVTAENTRPAQSSASLGEEPELEPHCASCGRPFRGDWDRFLSSEGVLCLICKRQAAEPTEAPAPGREPLPKAISTAKLSTIRPPKTKKPPPSRREVVIFVTVSAVLIGAAMLFPVERYIAEFFSQGTRIANEDFTTPVWIAFLAVNFLVGVISTFVVLYTVLSWSNKLPNDSVQANTVSVGLVCLLIHVITFIMTSYGLGLLSIFPTLAILFLLYEPGFKEFANLLVASLILKPIIWAIELVAYSLFAVFAA